MIQARDGMVLWLEHLRTGKTQAPRKHQGVYYLELPPDYRWDVLCEVRAVLDIFAPSVSITSFLQTSEVIYPHWHTDDAGLDNLQVSSAREFYRQLFELPDMNGDKQFLVQLLHTFALLAEGHDAPDMDPSVAFRKNYCACLAFPYLPRPEKNGWNGFGKTSCGQNFTSECTLTSS